MSRKATQIQKTVREILREGGEPQEGGFYAITPLQWETVNLPAFINYRDRTLRFQAQADRASEEYRRVRSKLRIYPEDVVGESMDRVNRALAGKKPTRAPVEVQSPALSRAQAITNFGQALKSRVQLQEAK